MRFFYVIDLAIAPVINLLDFTENLKVKIGKMENYLIGQKLQIPIDNESEQHQKIDIYVQRDYPTYSELLFVCKLTKNSFREEKTRHFGYKSLKNKENSFRYIKAALSFHRCLVEENIKKDLSLDFGLKISDLDQSEKLLLQTENSAVQEFYLPNPEKSLSFNNSPSDNQIKICDFNMVAFQPTLSSISFQEFSLFPSKVDNFFQGPQDFQARFLNESEICTLPNGDLILVGGSSLDNILKYRHVMIVYSKLHKCQLLTVLAEPRKGHSVKYIHGLIYIFGGRKPIDNVGGKSVLCYDPAKCKWMQKPELLSSYEINAKDFMEVFWNESVIVVSLRKNFQMEYMKISENIWKKLETDKSLGNFSDCRVVKMSKTHAFLILQDALCEFNFTLVRFDFQLLKFERLIAVENKKINLKFSFLGNNNFISIFPDQFTYFNVPSFIETNVCEVNCSLFGSTKNGELLIDVANTLKTKPSKVFSSSYNLSTIEDWNLFRITEVSIESCVIGASMTTWIPIQIFHLFSFHNRKKHQSLELKLKNCLFCSLGDSSLFIYQQNQTGIDFSDECFIQTNEGCIQIENPPFEIRNAEILNHQQFVVCLSPNRSNILLIFDLQTGKWRKPLKLSKRHFNFKLFADDAFFSILEFKDENSMIRSKIDLVTNQIICSETHSVLFDQLADFRKINLNSLKNEKLLFLYEKTGNKNGLFVYDFSNRVQSIEMAPFSGKIHFSIIIKENINIFCTDSSSEFAFVKVASTQVLLENFSARLSVELYDVQTKLPKSQTENCHFLPQFNISSSIPCLNYFKYCNFQNIQETHDSKFLFLADGIYDYGFEMQTLRRKRAIDMKNFPDCSSGISISEGKCIVTGGIVHSQLKLTISSDVILYNLLTHTHSAHSKLLQSRFHHSNSFSSCGLFVIGGYRNFERTDFLASVEKFNFRSGCWLNNPELNVARAEFDVVSMFSTVFVFFGNTSKGITNSVEFFDQKISKWVELESSKSINLPKLKSHRVLYLSFCSVVAFAGETDAFEPNFNFYVINWEKGYKNVPSISVLENRLLSSINRPFAFVSLQNIVIFGDQVNIYKHSQDQSSIYSLVESCDRKIGKPKLMIEKSVGFITSSNEQFQSPKFRSLYLIGVEQHPYFYRLDLENFSWEVLKSPKNHVFLDYFCCVTLYDGRIFISGGIDSKSTQIAKTAFLLNIENNEIQSKVLCPMITPRYTFTGVQVNCFVYVMGGRKLGTVQLLG